MTVTDRTEPELKDGKVVAIAGPVVDVEFPRGALPEINHARRSSPSSSTARRRGHRRGRAADR